MGDKRAPIKMKPKVDLLPKLKTTDYLRLFQVNIKKLAGSAGSTDCLIFTAHKFTDGKKVKGVDPVLLMMGDMDSGWKNKFNKQKKEDASMGECMIRREGAKPVALKIVLKKGRPLKADAKKRLEKIISAAKLKLEIVESLESEGVGDKMAAAGAALKEKFRKKKKPTEEQMEAFRAELEKDAQEMGVDIKAYKEKQTVVLNRVVKKYKKGTTTRKDLKIISDAVKDGKAFLKKYSKTKKTLQKKFKKEKAAIEDGIKKLAILGKNAAKRKKSLAQQLADHFFQKSEKREATNAEIDMMQNKIKAAVAYRKISELDGAEKQNNLKAIYIAARYRGPVLFKNKDVDVIYKKLTA